MQKEKIYKHVDGGLSLTKKRLGEFFYSCGRHNIEVFKPWYFANYHGSSVFVALAFKTEEQIKVLLKDCPWLILIDPPKVDLN